MKRVLMKSMVLVAVFSFACLPAVLARDISAIVSADWLERNLNKPKLIILDIRKVEEYREGLIPGAVNAYFGTWAYSKDGKTMEIPQEDDLFDAMGDAGLHPDSCVVVTCRTSHCYFQVQSARVFCTLQYGGLENVGILDGGFDQWVRENKPIFREIVKPQKPFTRRS